MNGKAVYSAIKFDALINSNMSFKCPICTRTFSRRTAYSQHIPTCLKKAEAEDEEVFEMGTKGDQDIDYENDNIEVIVLF